MTMAITGVDPIIEPAKPERVWPSRWITRVTILSPSLTEGSVLFESVGFDPATGEIQAGPTREFVEVRDLWATQAAVPEGKSLLNAVIAAYAPVKTHVDSLSVPDEPNP